MFKRFVAVLLLVALISSNFSRFCVYAGFELNRSYIAKELCENKARPWMHCNGKCYFMKKIKQAADNEKKQESKDNLNKLEVSFFQEPFKPSFREPKIIEADTFIGSGYNYLYTSQHIDAIFRPPKQVA